MIKKEELIGKHNKKRNTYMLFEFLSIYVTKNLLENNKSNILKATNIIKKYFKRGKILREELNMFDRVLKAKELNNSDSILQIIKLCLEDRCLLNKNKLNIAKANLIKEINHQINEKEFFDTQIQNYKIYANIQRLFDLSSISAKELDKIGITTLKEQTIKIKDFLVSDLKNKELLTETKELPLDQKYTNVVLKLVIKKFNEKYSKLLNENQRKFLSQFIIYKLRGVEEKITELVDNYKTKVCKDIKKSLILNESINQNSELKNRIFLVEEKISIIDSKQINDDNLITLLTADELIEELKNNDNF